MKKRNVKKLFAALGIVLAVCIGFGVLGNSACNVKEVEEKSSRTKNKSTYAGEGWLETTSDEYEYCFDTGYDYSFLDYEDMNYVEEVCYDAESIMMESDPSSVPKSSSSGSNGFYTESNSLSGEGESFTWDTTSYSGESGYTVNASDRKMIKNVSLTVETTTFDDFLDSLQDRIFVYEGYVESMETWNNSRNSKKQDCRDAVMTIRIPSAKMDNFVSELGDNCNVLMRSESVNDITATYTDYESKRTVLKTEEERLLSFMEDAETVDEMLSLESRLTAVQSEIESIDATLRGYDNRVAYSTVRLKVNEVIELTEKEEVVDEPEEKEPTFAENLLENFMMTITNIKEGAELFAYWLARNVIAIVILAVITLVVVHKVKKAWKKSAVPSEVKEEPQIETADNTDK